MSNASQPSAGPLKIGLRFANKRDFTTRYLPNVGFGGYQLAREPLELETQILLSLTFVGYSERFELFGKVVWRHSAPPGREELGKGVGVEFLPVSRTVLKELLEFIKSRDEDESVRSRDDRQEHRLAVKLEAQYLYEGKLTTKTVSDISLKGLFIETQQALPDGSVFVFFLENPGSPPVLVLQGRVAWSEEHARRGFGVELIFDSMKIKQEFTRYYQDLAESNKDSGSGSV